MASLAGFLDEVFTWPDTTALEVAPLLFMALTFVPGAVIFYFVLLHHGPVYAWPTWLVLLGIGRVLMTVAALATLLIVHPAHDFMRDGNRGTWLLGS
jgi:hypothetical protein